MESPKTQQVVVEWQTRQAVVESPKTRQVVVELKHDKYKWNHL